MSPSVTDETVRAERARVRRLARETPDVVFVGYRSGQLAVRFDRARDGVRHVELARLDAPGGCDAPEPFYHLVVRAAGGADADHRHEVFRHPFPALERLNETVPAFDLLEFSYVNEPDDEAEEGDAASSREP